MKTGIICGGFLILTALPAEWMPPPPQTMQPATRPASGVLGWERSRPFVDWNAGAPYTGPCDAVIVHDMRWPARPGKRDACYTNAWLMLPQARHANAVGTWLEVERLRYQACAPAIVAFNAVREADGRLRMPAVGSGYFGRLLVDPRHPAAAAAIAAEAQAAVRAGYRIVFDDNANMANADTYQGLVDPTRTLTDADVWAMYAAAITIQRTEFVRMGASVEICVNVGAPWRHPDCAGFWWDLGVRAVMLEQPDKRGPGDPTWGAWQQFGTAWLNKGGTLYIILANEQVGAGLAAALDSERTFVTR